VEKQQIPILVTVIMILAKNSLAWQTISKYKSAHAKVEDIGSDSM
jgi:DNA-binding transcriptional regulator of glucitol operon